MGPQKSFGCGPLEERAGRRIDRRAQEIVTGGVPDVEPDGRVELRQVHEVRWTEIAALLGRSRCQRFGPQFRDGAERRDAEDAIPLLGRQTECSEEKKGSEMSHIHFTSGASMVFHASSSWPMLTRFPPRTKGRRSSFGSRSIRCRSSASDTLRYLSPASTYGLPSTSKRPARLNRSMNLFISPGANGLR